MGESMPKISASLGVHKRTPQRWQKLGPEPSVCPKQRPKARKLSTATSQALLEYVDPDATTTLPRQRSG